MAEAGLKLARSAYVTDNWSVYGNSMGQTDGESAGSDAAGERSGQRAWQSRANAGTRTGGAAGGPRRYRRAAAGARRSAGPSCPVASDYGNRAPAQGLRRRRSPGVALQRSYPDAGERI